MNNIILFCLNNIVILWFIMLIILSILIFKENIHKSILSKEVLKDSRDLFRLYIDQYYITNKIITFSMCLIYVFGVSLIFIMLRYLYIGSINAIGFVNQTESFLLVSNYLKVCITIILYKFLLDIAFKKEINKLYLYFMGTSWYWYMKYHDVITFKLAEYIIGCLRVPCYRIATLTYKEDMYPLGFHGDLEYIHEDEYDYSSENKTVVKMILKLQDLAQKHFIIQNIFRILAYILRFIHVHISGINKQLPYFILFMTFLIELYQKEFSYIYIVSFIVLLLKTKSNLALFINKRSYNYDDLLSQYFYKNEVDYAKQRLSFFQNNTITISKSVSSSTNKDLYREQKSVIEYIFNKFIWRAYNVKYHRRKAGIYRRFLMLFSFIYITSYIIIYKFNNYLIEGLSFTNIPLMLLFIPLLIMAYCGYKSHYPIEYEEDPRNAEWAYNRKHNIIFWAATILQGYVFWVLLLQPELFFMDEILFNHIIKITRVYTVEEKILYIYQYFDHYIQSTALTIEEQDIMRYKLRLVDFKELINETTTFMDIHCNMRYWIAEKYFENYMYVMERLMEQEKNSWYYVIRNILGIGGISTAILKTISYYGDFFTVLGQLQNPYSRYQVAHDTWSTLFPHINRYRWSIFIHKIFENKLPSVLDIILYLGLDYIPLQIRIFLMFIIGGFLGTFVLPGIIDSFETPVVTEIKVSVILLEDMSTIPVIPTYNLYYFIVAFVIFISMSLLLKMLANKRKKELKNFMMRLTKNLNKRL